jgi:hypothetical protein
MILEPQYAQNYTVRLDDGTPIGHFRVENHAPHIFSIHTGLRPEYIGKGLGRQMYDEAQKLFPKKILVPSPSLSPYSTKFWQRRAPHLLKFHTEASWNGGIELANRKLYAKLIPSSRLGLWWYRFKRNYLP